VIVSRLAVAALVLPLSGCFTSLTLERISPSQRYMDFVNDVTAARREPSGAVVICVFGLPARTPSPFGHGHTAFSVTLPPNPRVQIPKSVRREIPEYQVTAADVGGACPAKVDAATPLPVRRIESSKLGHPDFFMISYDALAPLMGAGTDPSALWVVDSTYKRLLYIDESPRFEGLRAVQIRTFEREVKGEPAYALLLPLAVVGDVLMSPIYLLMALAGGPHGR
jgi:hypothetical protein